MSGAHQLVKLAQGASAPGEHPKPVRSLMGEHHPNVTTAQPAQHFPSETGE